MFKDTLIPMEVLELIIGITLMITGWLITFLMVLDILPRDFFLSLLAYAISLAGFGLGMHGGTLVIISRRRKRLEKIQS